MMSIVGILYVVVVLAILIFMQHTCFMLAFPLSLCHPRSLLACRPIIVHISYNCIKDLMMMNIQMEAC
jgi:hypothetical protein